MLFSYLFCLNSKPWGSLCYKKQEDTQNTKKTQKIILVHSSQSLVNSILLLDYSCTSTFFKNVLFLLYHLTNGPWTVIPSSYPISKSKPRVAVRWQAYHGLVTCLNCNREFWSDGPPLAAWLIRLQPWRGQVCNMEGGRTHTTSRFLTCSLVLQMPFKGNFLFKLFLQSQGPGKELGSRANSPIPFLLIPYQKYSGFLSPSPFSLTRQLDWRGSELKTQWQPASPLSFMEVGLCIYL